MWMRSTFMKIHKKCTYVYESAKKYQFYQFAIYHVKTPASLICFPFRLQLIGLFPSLQYTSLSSTSSKLIEKTHLFIV